MSLPIRFWLLSVATACCACSLVAYSTILRETSQHLSRRVGLVGEVDLPASLKSPRTTSQPVNPTIHQKPRRGYHKRTRQITHRRPPSTFHSEATARRRREPLQLSRNHVSLWGSCSEPANQPEKRSPRNPPCLIKSLRWCHLTS